MNRRIVPFVLLATLSAITALTGTAALATATAPTNVSVTYDHPEQFTETRKVRALAPQLADDDYLKVFKSYLEDRAGRMLPPGERLDIVVTDIDRAGNFEPWRRGTLREVRIIKDVYPPRIDLRFRLLDANGKVIREGTRKLRDPSFMSDSINTSGSDSLRYEKALIERWLRKGPDQL